MENITKWWQPNAQPAFTCLKILEICSKLTTKTLDRRQ